MLLATQQNALLLKEGIAHVNTFMETTSVNRAIKQEQYIALLLRLWQENEDEPWRAMIEDPVSGIRQGFPDLDALFEYLQAQTATTPETGDETTR